MRDEIFRDKKEKEEKGAPSLKRYSKVLKNF